jgi:putative ABC transport system substrate-binding protein
MRAACLAAAVVAAGSTWGQRIIVLVSADTLPYQQAIAGVQSLGVPVTSLRAANVDETNAASLKGNGQDVALVTFGASAAALAARLAPSSPAVKCMIGGNEDVRALKGQVVPLDIPIDAQIESLRQLLPGARNVGILFDPAQNERRAEDAAGALQAAGFVPVLEPVAGPTALPNALLRLATRVDVLLALPDPVFAGQHARALLLFSFRRHVPIVGPNEAWVKAGALYAVEWDYTDLGRYCGALALHPHAKPAPARTRVVANGRSAEQLGVTWDAGTSRSFDKVYP